ncbi:hypothetical protein DV702_15395 [Sporosarcina sp. PTS2304]|nr:hypothetical protein DV702_15395 [Sporosarcina sp. PTS2304]
MSGEQEGPIFVYLYLLIDGEVDHGIESFMFQEPVDALNFIKNFHSMTALEFMISCIGCPPTIY